MSSLSPTLWPSLTRSLGALQNPEDVASHLIKLLQLRVMPAASVRTSEDAAVEPLFRMWKRMVRDGRDVTILKFDDSFNRLGGYYWRAVLRAFIKQRAKDALQPIAMSALVNDDELVDWMERGLGTDASPLDTLIAIESLHELWRLSGAVERREMLMALAYGVFALGIEQLAECETLRALARSAELADAAWWCFGTRDLSVLDPSYWGRASAVTAWSNGLVSNANTRTALRVAQAFRTHHAAPVVRRRSA